MPTSEPTTRTGDEKSVGGVGAGTIREITCQAIHDWGTLEPMQREWDAFVASAGADVYFTFDWCRTWWRHYGKAYQLCVLLLRREDQLVGLLPMMLDRLWLGPIPLRLAKLLGSEWTTVVMTPPVRLPDAESVYAAAIRHLLAEERCDAVRFSTLSGEGPHREWIQRACEQIPSVARLVRDRELGVNATLRLPETYDAYLAGLKSNYRSTVRRIRRKFEEEYTARYEVIDDPAEVEAAFDEFVALHQARWEAAGMPGHFGEFPNALEFNRDLLRTLARLGRVWMTRLRVGEKTVACEYNYLFSGVLYSRLAGRRIDDPWQHLHIARLSMLYLFEACMARHVHFMHIGTGGDQHKREMGASEAPFWSMVIAANRPWAAFKSGPLLRLHWRLVHLLYYRVWFQTVAPRLPRFLRRPFWNVWLRSRV